MPKIWIYKIWQLSICADAVKQFSDGPVEEIDENNTNLKCFMHCMFHTDIESHEEAFDSDEMDLFTDEEYDIWLEMIEKCHPSSNDTMENEHTCESAFKFNKCLKLANPEVFPNIYETFEESILNSVLCSISVLLPILKTNADAHHLRLLCYCLIFLSLLKNTNRSTTQNANCIERRILAHILTPFMIVWKKHQMNLEKEL